MIDRRRVSPRFRAACAAAAAAAGVALAMPQPAHAWWRGGVFFNVAPFVPFYYAQPYYYVPPPVVYAPPVYTAPPAYVPPDTAQSCYAGAYVCPLARPAPTGQPCSCPAEGGGRVGGRVG
jgi:hypothetical protein